MENEAHTAREAVGVFDDADALQGAIDELLSNGFAQVDLNLLARDETVREKLGGIYDRVEQAEDDPDAPRTLYVAPETRGNAKGGLIGGLIYIGALAAAGTVVASGGAMAVALGAAVAAGAGGGVIGGALATVLEKDHANYVEEQLSKGGLLLWVSLRDQKHEETAVEILRRHSASDVHVHDFRD